MERAFDIDMELMALKRKMLRSELVNRGVFVLFGTVLVFIPSRRKGLI